MMWQVDLTETGGRVSRLPARKGQLVGRGVAVGEMPTKTGTEVTVSLPVTEERA
jgi:hypothetical protein